MTSSLLRPFRLALTGILVACGRDAAPAAPAAISTVSNAEYLAAPRLPLIAGSTLCDTGATDCDLGIEVSAVDDVNGGTMVWEFAKPIRRYDSTGHRLRDLGRKGKGPGEYDIAVAVSASPTEIKVVDVASLRMAHFAPDGGFLEFTSIRNIPRTARQLLFLDGDAVVFSVQPLANGSGSAFRAVRLKGDGRSDTLALQMLPGYVSREGGFYEMPGLFGPRLSWTVGADSTVLFTTGEHYEIWQYRGGVASRQLVVDQEPRKVEPAEVEREAARMRARSGRLGQVVEDAIRRVAQVHPAITQLVSVPGGGMLVRESPDPAGDSVRWSRFNDDWRLSSYVLLPESARLLLIRGERMLVMEQMETGVRLQWYALP